jgi:hypothetical protein
MPTDSRAQSAYACSLHHSDDGNRRSKRRRLTLSVALLSFCLTSAEYNGLCFASARTLSKSAKRLSHISLSHPRQPYNSSWKQTLTTVFEPCTSVLFCWTLWATVGQDTKLPPPPEKFLLPFSFLPLRTHRAQHINPAYTTTQHPNSSQTSNSQLSHQHTSNHGSQPLPQIARALQRVHLPPRVHLEEPI